MDFCYSRRSLNELKEYLDTLQTNLEKTNKKLEELYNKPLWTPRRSRFDIPDPMTSDDEFWVKRRQQEEKRIAESRKEIRSSHITMAKYWTLEIELVKQKIAIATENKQVCMSCVKFYGFIFV